MFDRIARSWDLLKQSWGVLRQDKALVVFPILSGIACVLVLASFAVPAALLVDWRAVAESSKQGVEVQRADNPVRTVGWVLVTFAYYFCNYFVIVFFNTALVSCAITRFRGGEPTVGDGFRAAGERLPVIFAWAAVAATVGTVLKMIEERLGIIGKFIIGLVGFTWTVVTYFVVPVLAVENVGPFAAVKRSAGVLRKTWGESLVGSVSLSSVTSLLAIPAVFLILGGVVAGVALQSVVVGIAGVAAGLLAILALAIVSSTLTQIYLAGVYLYAAEGVVPSGFREDTLRGAFRHK